MILIENKTSRPISLFNLGLKLNYVGVVMTQFNGLGQMQTEWLLQKSKGKIEGKNNYLEIKIKIWKKGLN